MPEHRVVNSAAVFAIYISAWRLYGCQLYSCASTDPKVLICHVIATAMVQDSAHCGRTATLDAVTAAVRASHYIDSQY